MVKIKNCGANHQRMCSKKECLDCYNRSLASIPRVDKCWSHNDGILPRDVTRGSHFKYKIICDDCGHEFGIYPSSLSKGSWCTFCASKELCTGDCEICYNKSFASHAKSACWSKKNQRTAREEFLMSGKPFIFDCDTEGCDYQFIATPGHIVYNGIWCPHCCLKPTVFCEKDDCKRCFDRSFASHPRSKYWSDKNKIKPNKVTISCSTTKYIFKCERCPHEFKKYPSSIVHDKQWCPYCSGYNTKLCKDDTCSFCYYNSFASHPKSVCWSKDNDKHPRDVCLKSGLDFIFNCDNCKREFVSKPCIVEHGSWCLFCKQTTESIVYTHLFDNFKVIREYQESGCISTITGRQLRFDFKLSKYNVLIELDGRQHFEQVADWDSPEYVQSYDIYKIVYAFSRGYSFIRLLQDNVWNDRYDWHKALKENIKHYDIPTLMLLTKDDTYDIHLKKLREYIAYYNITLKFEIKIINPYIEYPKVNMRSIVRPKPQVLPIINLDKLFLK